MRICLLAFCLGLALPSRFSALSGGDLLWTLVALVFVAVASQAALHIQSGVHNRSVVHNQSGVHKKLPPISASAGFQSAVRVACRLLLCLLLGLAWALWLALRQQAVQLPLELEQVDFWVEGVIAGLVERPERSQRFELLVEDNCFRVLPEQCREQPDVLIGQRIVLSDYSGLALRTGERWRLRVRLTRAYGLANPGARDSQARLRQRGIVARGYIRETPLNHQLGQSAAGLQRWRADIGARLDGFVGLPQRGVLKALVIGDYSGLSNAQWDIFNITGTSHLMVISGMHVGFVALLMYGLVNLLCRLSIRLLSLVAAQRLASVAALLAALLYSLLAGFSLPTQRAMIMLTVLMAGRLFGRRLLPSYSLLLAATLVLMRDPLAVTQPGFWLSFMAVASLMLGLVGYLPVRRRPERALRNSSETAAHWWNFGARRAAPGALPLWQRGWQRWVVPQWVVSCGLLLPLLLWTGQVSLVSPLTNVLAIPLVSLAVVPAALLGTLLLWVWPPLAWWLLTAADALVQLMMPALSWVADGGNALWPVVWQPAPPSLWGGILLALASLILLLPRGLVSRWYAVLLLLPVLWPQPPARPLNGQLWAHFLDVGQGLAVVVQTRQHALLFDTGPSQGEDIDAGQTVIVPFLRQQRIDALSLVIVSHWHDDHSGGLQSVMQRWPVSAVMAGRRPATMDFWQRSTEPSRAPIEAGPGVCRAGWQWVWDEVRFTILHPHGSSHVRENDYSCVLRIDAGEQSLLLTGDIEAAAERALVARHGSDLQAAVLQAAHHGSRTSSTAPFVDAVQPQLVIIPAAYHNRFGHPADEVVARFVERGIPFLQTGRSGAISLQLGVDTEVVGEYREQARRYWHHLPP